MSVSVEPNIQVLVPYQPGKPIEETQRELGLEHVVKLASNENPLGPSPMAQEAIKKAAAETHLYPDGGAYYLKDRLGKQLGRKPTEIVISNGSNEAIALIARTFWRPGCRALLSEAAFIMFPIVCTATNTPMDTVPMRELRFDLEAMAKALKPETRFVFLDNPNNPTGTYFTTDQLTWFLDQCGPETLVVLDQAYAEYVDNDDYPDGLKLQRRYPNLIVLRTFSKVYGLAGIRVGYAVMSEELASYVERVRDPFNVNLIGQRAATAALDDVDFVRRSVELNNRGIQRMTEALRGEFGLDVLDSVANFILVRTPKTGVEMFQEMLPLGVIVRPMVPYKLLDHMRVSVGTDAEVDAFLDAMRKLLG